jgi:hypothetical protein
VRRVRSQIGRDEVRDAIHEGAVAPLIGDGFYTQSEIHELLNWALNTVPSSDQYK